MHTCTNGNAACAGLNMETRSWSLVFSFILVILPISVEGGPGGATVSCEVTSHTAIAGGSVLIDVFVTNILNVRGFQSAIDIAQISGSGDVSLDCPTGATVDLSRSDFVFAGLDTEIVEPGCTNCGVVMTDCEGRRVATARLEGTADVGAANAYLA